MKEKAVSLLLALSLCLGMLPARARAADNSIPGTAPIPGATLSQYGINEVKIGDTEVSGSVYAVLPCTLHVAFYSVEGQLLSTKCVPVSVSIFVRSTAQDFRVEIPENIPEYFRVKAFLLDNSTMNPLCKSKAAARLEPQIECAELDEEHIATGMIAAEDGTVYEGEYVDNQIIVVAADGVFQFQIATLVRNYGGSIVGYIESIGYYQVELPTSPGLEGLNDIINQWTASPLVEEAYLNMITNYSVNNAIDLPWGGSDFSEDYPSGNNWGFEAIHAASAQQLLRDHYERMGKAVPSVKVGVIDSCFDKNHKDLNFKDIFYNAKESVNPGNLADKVKKIANIDEFKDYTHGTHVAGILAANGNNFGISGVALNPILYGYEMKKETDEDTCYTITHEFGDMTAFARLIKMGARVINFSVGYELENSDVQRSIVRSQGRKVAKALSKLLKKGDDFVIVTAAGNGMGANKDALFNNAFTYISDWGYPDVYNRIIVVSAAENNTPIFEFDNTNNYGTRIDVVAPGYNIYSTVSPNQTFTDGRSYVLKSGTSMATPYVAGVAALLYAANPKLTGAQVKKIILDTADIPVQGTDSEGNASKNMVNAKRAVASALGMDDKVSGTDRNGNSWEFADGQLAISGTSALDGTMTLMDDIFAGQYYYQNAGQTVTYYPWSRYINYTTSIKINNGITQIGPSAFFEMKNLISVTLPDSLTEIGDMAFCRCSNLKSVLIPASVTTIGKYAVGYEGEGDESWEGKEVDGFIIYGYPGSAAEAYAAENGIEFRTVGVNWELDEETGTLYLTGCGPMEDYKNYSTKCTPWYGSCNKIKNIAIGEGVTSIGDYAFEGCSGLTSIVIPNSVTSIGDSAFKGCSGLTSIVIPNNVTSVGDSAFKGCSRLASIVIPDSVTSIGNSTFDDCYMLTDIVIPDGVTTIGNSAFYDCFRLTDIVIPDSVTAIGNYAFKGCSGLTSIVIPDSVTSIGDSVFYGCYRLTDIVIPDGVTTIENSAFFGCRGLTSIVIPDSVTAIGNSAFNGCSDLTSIVIPDSVTSIGYSAFNGCSGLNSIVIPVSVINIGNSAFNGCSDLTSIVVPDGVTSIGDFTFHGCSALASIVIPDSVTSIGNSAFKGCSGLNSIVIPVSVINIGNSAFNGCSGLTSIVIPANVTSIGDSTFYGCRALTSIVIPDSITSIESNAFYNCRSLTSIVIPAGVTSIGNSAFFNCRGLTSIVIPSSVTSIEDSAFSGCYELTDVYYAGLETDWEKISVDLYNSCLTSSTIHYNSTGPNSDSGT